MLSDLCKTFLAVVETLDPSAPGYAAIIASRAQQMARDAAELIADYPNGGVEALIQLCENVLSWLKSVSEDPHDPARRDGQQRAVADLISFCRAICAGPE